MKKFAFIMVAALSVLLITSCEDKKTSYPPVFKGFTVEPSKPCAGDSITIKACVDKKGSLLYSSTYNWGLSMTTIDNEGFTHDTVIAVKQTVPSDGTQYKDPVVKFRIPKDVFIANGRSAYATIKFSASYKNAADGEAVGIMGGYTGEGCFGSIESNVATLYSGASGSGRFNVYPKQ